MSPSAFIPWTARPRGLHPDRGSVPAARSPTACFALDLVWPLRPCSSGSLPSAFVTVATSAWQCCCPLLLVAQTTSLAHSLTRLMESLCPHAHQRFLAPVESTKLPPESVLGLVGYSRSCLYRYLLLTRLVLVLASQLVVRARWSTSLSSQASSPRTWLVLPEIPPVCRAAWAVTVSVTAHSAGAMQSKANRFEEQRCDVDGMECWAGSRVAFYHWMARSLGLSLRGYASRLRVGKWLPICQSDRLPEDNKCPSIQAGVCGWGDFAPADRLALAESSLTQAQLCFSCDLRTLCA